jgi:hypothetical protein
LFEATELGRNFNDWLGEKSQQVMEAGTNYINDEGRIGNLQKSAQITGGLMLGVGLVAGGVKMFTKLAGSVGTFFSKISNRPDVKPGEFSIVDWSGYPAGVPKPQGTVRLIEGAEQQAAEAARKTANSAYRREHGLEGVYVDVHEIKPIKFGGSPTDSANKIVLDRDLHRKQVTPWWSQLQRDVQD